MIDLGTVPTSMMTATDISQLMAAQTQQQMLNAAYAQQVTASSGLDSRWQANSPWGRPAGAGVGSPPPVFSYAPQGMTGGYGFGNRVAGGGMALGGAAALTGLGYFVNPLSSFAGAAYGSFMGGAGFGGAALAGMGAAALPLGVTALAGAGVGAVMHGAQQQQAIQSQLSQFRFMNPMSRTGSGFTRDDASVIGEQIRSLAHIPEMLTSVEELTRLLPRLKSSGLMSNTRDATEFASKFKQAVVTIKDVSKLMGTTMEEAASFFAQSRTMGFLNKRDQVQNAVNVGFTSTFTGMDTGAVVGMQNQGAQAARQFGGRGRAGAEAITSLSNRIRQGVLSGTIQEDVLQDFTGGLTGEDAITAASEKSMRLAMGFTRTSAGRLAAAGMMEEDENGRVRINRKLVEKLNRGEISHQDLMKNVENMSDEKRLTFMHRAAELAPQLAGQLDIGKYMEGITQGMGKDAAGRVLQTYFGEGVSSIDIDFLKGVKNGPGDAERLQALLTRAREANIREKSPAAVWKRVIGKLENASGYASLKEWGADQYSDIGRSVDEAVDEVMGRYIADLSKEGAKAVADSLTSARGRDELEKRIRSAAGYKEGMQKIRLPGERALNAAVGGSAGAIVGGAFGTGVAAAGLLATGAATIAGGGLLAPVALAAGAVVGAAGGAYIGDALADWAGTGAGLSKYLGDEYNDPAALLGFGTSVSQNAKFKRLMGVDGVDPTKSLKLASTAAEKLRPSMAGINMRKMAYGIEGYNEMPAVYRLEAMKKAIDEKVRFESSDEATKLRIALFEAEKQGHGVDATTTVALAGLGSGSTTRSSINVAELGMLGSDAAKFAAVRGSSERRLSAEDTLSKTKGVGRSGLALVKSSRAAGDLLSKLLDDSSPDTEKLLATLENGTLEGEYASIPKSLYGSILDQYNKIQKAGTQEESRQALNVYGVTSDVGDLYSSQRLLKESAATITDQDIKAAMDRAVSYDEKRIFEPGYVTGKHQEVSGVVDVALQTAKSMSPDKRDDYIRSLGPRVGGAVRTALAAGSFQGTSVEDITKTFGFSSEDATKLLKSSGADVGRIDIDALQQRIAEGAFAQSTFGGGKAGPVTITTLDESMKKLVASLDTLNETIQAKGEGKDLMSTIDGYMKAHTQSDPQNASPGAPNP